MTRFALFLRGVNVGGVTIAMADLRALLEGIGARDVTTWLASGNVGVEWAGDRQSLTDAAMAGIGQHYGRTVPMVVLAFEELHDIVAGCPFAPDPDHHRYVVLCESPGIAGELVAGAPALDTCAEQVSAAGAKVYWRCPKGSSLTTAFAKHQTRFAARRTLTVRNLNTLERMLR